MIQRHPICKILYIFGAFSVVLGIPSHEKDFRIQLIVFILSGSQEVKESLVCASTVYPARTQRNRLVQNADISIFLKCHKMLLMSHFDKTVISIRYFYHQGSPNRHMYQESKLKTIKRHMTSSKQIFVI